MFAYSARLVAGVVIALTSGIALAEDAPAPLSVSEPGMLGLLAAGVGAAALYIRSRRKK